MKRIKEKAREVAEKIDDDKRYKDRQFNLTLAYVTDRILFVSLPANKIDALYKNDPDEVHLFLEKNHHSRYLIINLSSSPLNTQKFSHSVVDFPNSVRNYSPPPLNLLFQILKVCKNHLDSNPSNIIAFTTLKHSGRAATIIASLLLQLNPSLSPLSALQLYLSSKSKSFNTSTSSQMYSPSQLRYVNYFSQIISGAHIPPTPLPSSSSAPPPSFLLNFNSISFSPVPRIHKNPKLIVPFIKVSTLTKPVEVLYNSSKVAAGADKLKEGTDKGQVKIGVSGCWVEYDVVVKVYHVVESMLEWGRLWRRWKEVKDVGTGEGVVKGYPLFPLFRVVFHCEFVKKDPTVADGWTITFNKNELDGIGRRGVAGPEVGNDKFEIELKFTTVPEADRIQKSAGKVHPVEEKNNRKLTTAELKNFTPATYSSQTSNISKNPPPPEPDRTTQTTTVITSGPPNLIAPPLPQRTALNGNSPQVVYHNSAVLPPQYGGQYPVFQPQMQPQPQPQPQQVLDPATGQVYNVVYVPVPVVPQGQPGMGGNNPFVIVPPAQGYPQPQASPRGPMVQPQVSPRGPVLQPQVSPRGPVQPQVSPRGPPVPPVPAQYTPSKK
eukprot:TRINITY_DN7212_c0_g1_i1.p1 TRINITY_DN7212_c0_g1~~TRINITY_DN7212_c0_g1_i1.p1  ORF type:complete len:605 (-),score=168.29 TRINITY_DN7212_c0_g1_i1:28-1842(-)